MDPDESGNFVTLYSVQDPEIRGAQTIVLAQAGKNAQIREEHARSWTLGVDFAFPAVPKLSTALTYFNTTFWDRVNAPVANTALLSDPSFEDLLIRNPSDTARKSVCDSAPFFGGPAAACLTVPIAAIVDLRVRNSAIVHTEGIDASSEYSYGTEYGTIAIRLDGTYVFTFSEASSPQSVTREKVSTQSYPIDLRLRGALTWRYAGFRSSALLNYFDGYRDTASSPQRRVASWSTLDLNFSYELAGVTISLGAENVFDASSPFLNNQVGIGYDPENGDLTGRMLVVGVKKAW
jgi:iron complex outermembrane receptor protein